MISVKSLIKNFIKKFKKASTYETSQYAKELAHWRTPLSQAMNYRARSYVFYLQDSDYIAEILRNTPTHWNYRNLLNPSVQANYISFEHMYLLILLHKLNVRPPL